MEAKTLKWSLILSFFLEVTFFFTFRNIVSSFRYPYIQFLKHLGVVDPFGNLMVDPLSGKIHISTIFCIQI